MKLLNVLIASGIAIGILLVSCKKKKDEEVVPVSVTEYKLVTPFQASTSEVNFTGNDTNKVYFSGSLDKPTTIRVNIKGLTSFAQRNLIFPKVSKLDSSLSWNGSQDSLYYFRTGEKCIVTLYASNEVGEALLGLDTILIKKRRAMPSGQVELFPIYPSQNERNYQSGRIYTVGYDVEPNNQIERSEDLIAISEPANGTTTGEYIIDKTEWLSDDPYRKPIRGTDGDRYFILKGTDKVSKVTPYTQPDYYIGRLQSPNMLKNTPTNFLAHNRSYNLLTDSVKNISPENLYFNVFVYGNGDGSYIYYQVKELESNAMEYYDDYDESYACLIRVSFKGWRLISVPYSQFSYSKQKDARTGNYYDGSKSNKIKEPSKIINVQFSLVAGTLGGSGQMIIDCPVMSWGGPLKY